MIRSAERHMHACGGPWPSVQWVLYHIEAVWATVPSKRTGQQNKHTQTGHGRLRSELKQHIQVRAHTTPSNRYTHQSPRSPPTQTLTRQRARRPLFTTRAGAGCAVTESFCLCARNRPGNREHRRPSPPLLHTALCERLSAEQAARRVHHAAR